jgi:hypothetical protein
MKLHSSLAPARAVVALCLLAVLFLAGCGSSRLDADAIRRSPVPIPGVGIVTFTDGAYDQPADSLHVGQIDLFAYGDLDGDGTEDALTFLARKQQGPELLLTMEAFLNAGGRPLHAASYLLGDRVGIDSVSVEGRIVHLSLITQGPDDAPCCPTRHVHRRVRLDGREFTLLGGADPETLINHQRNRP